MRRPIVVFVGLWLAALALAGTAAADFGFKPGSARIRFTDPNGQPEMQAGAHPFAQNARFQMNTFISEEIELSPGVVEKKELPEGEVRSLTVRLPQGFTGNPYATPRCSNAEFIERLPDFPSFPACPDGTAVGVTAARIEYHALAADKDSFLHVPVYNLNPPPGVAAKLGFAALNVPVTIEFSINPDPPYNLEAHINNINQAVHFFAGATTIWGTPSSSAHDSERGHCLNILSVSPEEKPISVGSCPVETPAKPFLVTPRSCEGPLALTTGFEAIAWNSGLKASTTGTAEDEFGNPLGMTGCSKLGFSPQLSTQPTSQAAESPTGLDVHVDVSDEGILSPSGIAQSDTKKAVVVLPEGVTANPSQAEGLAVCSREGFAREKAGSAFGSGCPAASKIGTVELETPILENKILKGSVFIATPFENPFGSLLALYITLKEPELGVSIGMAGKVEPDPKTGQLISTFDDVPQQPFSHFRVHFREGGRSPLITPPLCGEYTTRATFTPSANPTAPYPMTSSFQITHGVNGGGCPSAGTPPFVPGFSAGSINNNAGAHSTFQLRLTRRDGDQDLTRLSVKLPPGVTATLAGVSRCSDAAIVAAKAKTGKQELASPSCPASSQIGSTLAGAGVGSQLTYVGGKLYLAGPFGGGPLSVVAITPAVAGPFDVGTVVLHMALRVNPRTGVASIDGANSDPIPHILAGIPLKVRDIRASVDRPDFMLNPTSCDPFAVEAELWGGGADPFSTADDRPVSLDDRYQASGCQRLGFKPRLSLSLKGGTGRGAHPALKAVYRPRPGDANLAGAVVRLPRSAFLDQGHIRTICTRVQFAAKQCPPGAVYGRATAYTPILDQPLRGPTYLRSSNPNLPDIVADLHGLVDVEAVGRIDSKNGGIRTTFEGIPDAPISKVVIELQGGKKGVIVNSKDLCAHSSRADVRLTAHNAKQHTIKPLVRAHCPKR